MMVQNSRGGAQPARQSRQSPGNSQRSASDRPSGPGPARLPESSWPGLEKTARAGPANTSAKGPGSQGLGVSDFDSSEVVSLQIMPYLPLDKSNYGYRRDYLTAIDDDLAQLLKMPHRLFWCQMLYDQSVHQFMDSYFRFCPRTFDELEKDSLARDFVDVERTVHRRVFLVTLRTATHRESPTDIINLQAFGSLIYENWLFDIPRLFDICVLYGRSNKDMVTRMIENIFKQQPKYLNDLEEFLPAINDVLEKIREACSQLEEEGRRKAGQIDKAQEQLDYLYDVATTTAIFLQCCPSAAKLFQHFHIPSRFCLTYESVLPPLYKLGGQRIRAEWRRCRAACVDAVHTLLTACYIEPLRAAPSDSNRELGEEYGLVVGSIAASPLLLRDYSKRHPLVQDYLALQTRHSKTIDGAVANRLMERIDTIDQSKRKQPQQPVRVTPTPTSTSRPGPSTSPGPATSYSLPTDPDALAVLESQISAIQEIVPVGSGFAALCLNSMAHSVEAVINALLEDQLPPAMAGVDRNMDISALRKSQPDAATTTSSTIKAGKQPIYDAMEDEPGCAGPSSQVPDLLATRHNIYDGDEFDVFNRGIVDSSRVHRGKMNKVAQAARPDKSLAEITKQMARQQEERELMEQLAKEREAAEYNDEYDDTYDSHDIGASKDVDSADEMEDILKPLQNRILPWAKAKQRQWSRDDDEEEEEEDEESGEAKEGESSEQKQTQPGQPGAQSGRVHPGQAGQLGHRGPNPPGQQKTQGPARGGGQGRGGRGGGRGRGGKVHATPEELKERAYKDKNKARFANHNRRVLADKKHSRGMGPLPTT
eukprot:comp19665_c0_seq1/m.23289 comp19665_c0_seq1/g.23289  ORF comp19665_c0_seq1/g.23289 comp19665_c0_seq1/m.23289 type:complete len:821 (-) comp19665_c0_seq1:432-2894(-)